MFVFSNLAISLDGKIGSADRSVTHLGSSADLRTMLKLRARCDAVLFGASTLRAYGKAASGPTTRKIWNVVLSSRLEGISPRLPFFSDPGIRRLLVVGSPRPVRARLFEGKAEILELSKRGTAADQILRHLGAVGVRRLLVEGGGSVMWQFVRQNLINEYHVTLTPQLIGGTESPTLVDGQGFSARKFLKLRLKSVQRVSQELFLVYTNQS